MLHGIAASSRSLRKLERAAASAGYRTLNADYSSRLMPFESLVEEVHEIIAPFVVQPGRTHFVTYSMGGLLARAYIAKYRPSRLGSVVMLAPPNEGSEVADLLVRSRAYRWFFGPAGSQLTTNRSHALRRLLGEIDYPLGIIAGDRFIDPLGWLLIPGANDGRVSVARTKLYGMTDHITLHATHFGMARNPAAIAQAVHFLHHGRFRAP